MFSVTISEKGGQQSEYEFSKPEITIGRMKGNDVVLPKGNVSKQHTRIFMRDGDFFIVDLKSTNGTYVNGRKITSEQRISETDKIYIGDFILQLQRKDDQAAQNQPPSPPPQQGGGQAGGGQSGGGDRNFPTVMEGSRDGNGSVPTGNGQSGSGNVRSTQRQPQQNPPQRSSTGAGSNPGPGTGADANQTPPPTGQHSGGPGEAGGNEDVAAELDPEPIDSDIEPLDDPDGGADPEPSPPSTPPPSQGSGSAQPADQGSNAPPSPPSPGADSPPSPSPEPDDGPASSSRVPSPESNLGSPSSPESAPSVDGDRDGDSDLGQPSQPSRPTAGGGEVGGDPSVQPMAEQPGAVGAGAAADREPLESDFDEAFHRAQQQVVDKLFDSTPPEEFPTDHPIYDATKKQQLTNAVENAVDTVDPDADRQRLVDALTDEALGLGPLGDYLEDDSIRAVYVNAYDRVVVRTGGELRQAERAYSDPEMLELAARRLLDSDDSETVSDQVRFDDGTRVHILMPPVAVEGPALTVQKPNRHFPSLDELAGEGSMSVGMAEFLERAVEAGRSVVIAGPTGSGKSTLMSALTREIPASSRVVALEQHSNLPLDEPNFIRLEASPSAGYDMRFLLRNAVAMHPERILLDECRGPEAYEWVTSTTGGTSGSMLTLHGTSADDALGRLESMCLMATDDISPRGLREQIAHSVDLVVVLNATGDEGFRVQQIAEVQGVDIDAFRLNDIFYYRVEGTAGDFHPTGYIPLFYEDLRHAGLDVDLDIFRE